MAGTVQINYGDGWKEMTATQTTGNIVVYTYKWSLKKLVRLNMTCNRLYLGNQKTQ